MAVGSEYQAAGLDTEKLRGPCRTVESSGSTLNDDDDDDDDDDE